MIRKEPDIEGVTFVGGEPFLQAAPLAALGRLCQRNGLSVVTFSGYTYAEICGSVRPGWSTLLAVTDLLLAGPYQAAEQDFSRPWVGSRNQEFVFLTPRYAYLKEALPGIPNHIEWRVQEDGTVAVNGMAPEALIGELRGQLAELGLTLEN